ncbi:MAG: hypothetical protein PWP07_2690 [Epulopiscium sp.]|nr:hypothetical protein [Candidatus Epulonipiscium sp.]
MRIDGKKCLTCILENGDERTIALNSEVLFDFVKWFQDTNSSNCYEIVEGADKCVTMFKNTILALRY